MFSGIVEAIGQVTQVVFSNDCLHVSLRPPKYFDDLQVGDSVCVNGVCLTVTRLMDGDFDLTVVPETLRLTNLQNLTLNDKVNLERSLKPSGRIGGHYVQGHVDGVGKILALSADGGDAMIAKISLPPGLAKYIVRKGYITIDGMSITVIDVTSEYFTVTFIPHTREVSIVQQYQTGACVNLEVDILAKYVESILGAHAHANTY